MRTFRELYCEKHRCTEQQFVRQLFWKALYPHALPFAPLLLLIRGDYFIADRSLIASVANAVTMHRVREEVRDYFWDSNNRGWLRRVANIRISGQRVKDIARNYLPESTPGKYVEVGRGSGAPF